MRRCDSRVRVAVATVDRRWAAFVVVIALVAGMLSIGAARAGAAPTLSATAVVDALSTYNAQPGERVTVFGSGFGATQGDSYVTCCGQKAEAVSWSDTQVVFIVPETATEPGYVGIVIDGVASNGMYFVPYAVPHVRDMTPREGAPGTTVAIIGEDFGSAQEDGWVTFAGIPAHVLSWSDTRIEVQVPEGASPGYAGVIAHTLTSNGIFFTPDGAPVVEQLSTQFALVGQRVTITGRNFGVEPGRLVVGGRTVTPDSWSNTSVSFTIDPTLRSGYVGVQRYGSLTSNGRYILVAPRVTGISSWWGPPGSQLSITGVGFGDTPGEYVAFLGGQSVTWTSWSDTQVTITVPQAPSGYVGVGTPISTSNGIYFVVETRATISSVSTTTISPGEVVTLTGTDFGPRISTSVVRVGGRYECEIQSWSATQITVKIPATVASGYLGVIKQGVASNGIWMNVQQPAPTEGVAPTGGAGQDPGNAAGSLQERQSYADETK